MMQMLDAGGLPALTDRARGQDEDNPRGYYELEAVKRTRVDPSWLERAAGRAVKMVHLILYDLPSDRSYRVVFMRRDLTEVVRSQATMLRHRGAPGGDLSEHELIQAYKRQLDGVERWLAAQPNIQALHVSYNRLMAATGAEVMEINRFLGGGLDTEAMIAAVDQSLYRQRCAPDEGGQRGES